MSTLALHPVAYSDAKEFAERLTTAAPGQAPKYARAVLATAMLHVVQEMMGGLDFEARRPVAESAYRCADQLVRLGGTE